VKPKIIVSVLESSSAADDVALTRGVSLAQWYESDLHVLDVRPSTGASRVRGNAWLACHPVASKATVGC